MFISRDFGCLCECTDRAAIGIVEGMDGGGKTVHHLSMIHRDDALDISVVEALVQELFVDTGCEHGSKSWGRIDGLGEF